MERGTEVEKHEAVDPVRVAVVLILAVLVIWYLIRLCDCLARHRNASERFASRRAREVTNQAQELFTREGDTSYSAYKNTVAGADPVQFSDVRRLWQAGRLTPDNVESVI